MASISEHVAKSGLIGVGAVGEHVKLVQRALLAAGHQLIPDGEFGTVTESAVKMVQASHHLNVVGYVGPKTAAALDEILAKPPTTAPPIVMPSVLKIAPHLATMRAITGTREVPGAANSPIIMSWRGVIAGRYGKMAAYTSGYTGDAIPWCGFGLAYCFAVNGLQPPFDPANNLRSFLWAAAWGRDSDALIVLGTDPGAAYPQGAVMTYTRNGGGHVALLEESGGGWDNIRGANQSDMVNVVVKGREQFTAATWPRSLPVPVTSAPRAKARGAVSGSER